MATKKRIEEIDILKALGIICMVAGHASAPFTHFLYLFHMAVFFIASGFFFKTETSDDFASAAKQIKVRLLQLWLPFFVWNTIFSVLHNYFVLINVYTDNPALQNYVSEDFVCKTTSYSYPGILKSIANGVLFSSSEPMFGTSWFLKVLFIVSVCYLIVDYLVKKVLKNHVLFFQTLVSLILLLFGYLCFLKGISAKGIAQAASFYCLYHSGRLLYLIKERYADWSWRSYLMILGVSFILLLFLNSMGSIALNRNSYENPFFLIAASMAGWAFLYSISFFIKQTKTMKSLMLIIGRRTLTIVILHFLSFKIVAACVVEFYKLPPFCLAALPNLYGDKGAWWLAYVLVGVGIPVIANICYRTVVDKFISKDGLSG